ncbi:MAG: endo-1,3-alpha-glucanase family glycosylhydrolase [Victivallales bacterium]|jgi:hypothetical protein
MIKALFISLVISIAVSVRAADDEIPKLVFTHAMGMMPAVNWYSANGIFPLNEYAKTKDPKDFAVAYGGSRRISGLGFYYSFMRNDSSYNFNEPYHLWWERKQTQAHPDFIPYDVSQLEDRYKWDLKMAEEAGIDAFGLCLSGNEPSYKHAVSWFDTMEKMIKEKPDTKLRVTMAICGDDLPTPEHPEKYEWLRRFVKERMDSPAWLRHKGRIFFMGYHNQIAWNSKDGTNPEYMKGAVEKHKKFFASLGIDPVFIFDGQEYVLGDFNEPIKQSPDVLKPVAKIVCDEFAGYSCWGGVIPDEIYPKNYTAISDEVNKLGKAWMMPIVDIHSGVGQFYKSLPGVERLINTWNFAEKTNARCVQLVTWNDTAEATGFQPSISWNYALWALNSKYMYRFKHGKFPEEKEDSIFLFYRKYHNDADPYLYPRATVERDRDKWGETDDMLHVIVFATDGGKLEVTGTGEGVSRRDLVKGFNEFKLTTAVGKEISAKILRNGKMIQELVSPEIVTDRPYREDLIPWGWSSYCRKLYDRDFGPKFRPISYYSQRYGDGIPDWFRLHYFATTELKPGVTGAGDDPDKDGVDNLHEYRAGENPLVINPKYSPGYTWDELTAALSMVTNLPAAERINMNPFPDKNGKLVHTFLYQSNGVFDGQYPHMLKWVNNVKGAQTGWAFRTAIKQNYFLNGEGTICMNLLKDWAGIYRFWSPADGVIKISCTFTVSDKTDVDFFIKDGVKSLFSAKLKPGETKTAEFEVKVKKWSRIDFIAYASGGDKAKISMKPVITLKSIQP